MIYLDLFLSFLKIGTLAFGGGYGIISMMRETALSNGWLTEEQLLDFIAVSESTPGPIAINMATFIGSVRGGIWGAVLATLGVILPSFVIILVISAVLKNFLKYKGVQAFMDGVRPCVVALILSTALTMGLTVLFGLTGGSFDFSFNIREIIILVLLVSGALIWKSKKKKLPPPIAMIAISAVMGIIAYQF